jgi:hypothetical protein
MQKKSILFLCVSVFTLNIVSAQSFMKGIGANISVLTAKINTPSERYNFAMSIAHFSYFPRWTFSEAENSSVSIGSPLGAGIGLLNGGGGGAEGIAWGADVPIALDYNTGCNATPDNEKTFGVYFGTGIGFMYTGWTDGGRAEKAISYGPLARAGIRFRSSRSDWAATIGLFFKYGLEKEKYKTFGVNILTDL